MTTHEVIPFTALVGQEPMKRALVLNAVNPAIGGVLIRGERGTAKSTAVRALAGLLPEIEVVEGCRFSCSPVSGDLLCDECRARQLAGERLPMTSRPMRVVELPINASEDRVVGTIDIETAIKEGERSFEPGVLAEANRNILYVDEVNLLDDHLVDVLLDAAAMGVNTVEREGMSAVHPSRFILVGTMNPEEGELRPQLLDRFGLCVDVSGLRSAEARVAVMETDMDRQLDPDAQQRANQAAESHLRAIIAKAQELLPLVEVLGEMRWLIALACMDAGVMGHRADIVVSRTAQTLCALREAEAAVDRGLPELSSRAFQVSVDDISAASELALLHRRRQRPGESSPKGNPPDAAERSRERMEELAEQARAEAATADSDARGEEQSSADAEQDTADQAADRRGDEAAGQDVTRRAAEQLFEGELFPIRSIKLPRDRKSRSASGKRSSSEARDKRGRYVRAVQTEKTTDVAFDATLRAAAPYQSRRRAGRPSGGPALRLERQDLRQKVRRRRTGTLIVFVVDASASMDAEQRMQATKGAVLSLLRDAYLRRDKVALVVFSGRTARVALSPTNSVDLAESRLQRLTVGGTTPLTHGLVAGLKLVHTERLRDPNIYPLIVLISDGRGNISLFGEEPLVEAQRIAEQIGHERIRTLIIDSARDTTGPQLPAVGGIGHHPIFGGYGFNACLDLAQRSGGDYLGLYDLSQGAIVAGVEKTLRGR
ncbi:MAG TPA: magnesium chelatase subunit D family protein [Candidatus Binatia bacterium]|nr:magnesium chelatase subunit D family protein [Candidatus Binatia bacterium]